jgi:hypothetical protein
MLLSTYDLFLERLYLGIERPRPFRRRFAFADGLKLGEGLRFLLLFAALGAAHHALVDGV